MEGLKLFVDKLGNLYFIASLFSLIIFLIGLINFLKRKKYQNNAVSAIGEVEELIEEVASNRNVFYPLVSFDIEEGKTVAYKSNIGTSPPTYKKKEKVKVLFYPENPKDFIIDDNRNYSIEVVFLIIGLIGFLTCITIFLTDVY